MFFDTSGTVLSQRTPDVLCNDKCAIDSFFASNSLILMSLYNVSINKKGLKYISAKPGILGLLTWLLQGTNSLLGNIFTTTGNTFKVSEKCMWYMSSLT